MKGFFSAGFYFEGVELVGLGSDLTSDLLEVTQQVFVELRRRYRWRRRTV